jgi:hypothetical protein
VAVESSASLRVRGLSDLNKELRELADPERFQDELKEAHFKVADLVRSLAESKIPVKTGAARESVTAQRTQYAARLSMGGGKAVHALGVEFGSKHDLRRIVKQRAIRFGTDKDGNRTQKLGRRTRATVVRDGEDIDAVIGRVTQQSVDEFGKTSAKGRGVLVKIATYKNGSPKVRRGWNQFRSWRGIGPNAGYAIYPTIRANQALIMGLYEAEVDKIVRDAFPD